MTSGEGAVQLRASGERAVLVGHDGVAEREMDPRRLPLGGELADALHEWAKVANAIRRAAATGEPTTGPAARPPGGTGAGAPAGSAGGPAARSAAGSTGGAAARSVVGSAAGAVVSRRGLQLAARVAAAIGTPVHYVDPLSGEIAVVEPPEVYRPARAMRPLEPVPWLTGLTVSAVSLVLVAFTVVTLAVSLAETNPLLALAANVVVTAGLLPSLWLIHRQPVWRWVAFGAAGGIALGWIALPFIVL